MTAPKNGPRWLKSSLSSANGNCVEVANLPGCNVGVRDSSKPDSAVLRFPFDEWHAFLGGARNGEFDGFGARTMRGSSGERLGGPSVPSRRPGSPRHACQATPPVPAGKALHAPDMQSATKKQSSPADGRDTHDHDCLRHYLRGRRRHTLPQERGTVDLQAHKGQTCREGPACGGGRGTTAPARRGPCRDRRDQPAGEAGTALRVVPGPAEDGLSNVFTVATRTGPTSLPALQPPRLPPKPLQLRCRK
jgi:hypothetical protein